MLSWRTPTSRAWRGLRGFLSVQVELHERAALLDRPWEEELLHWADDGRKLHGRLVPPPGRSRSTTSSGWCPGMVRNRGASPRTGSGSPA
ncbi:hypothetical protein [Geodermatophilus obscurus]|uniref:Uncharacterized protein n=1 Tax=Geodermatophilus obscurus (strain ATCC 25078 / DSM 43160 / JCM 3152 / CCUG 61914 / KCC A-0152 / KCTC 9177 / NBRC 13315 / NRRL B-3577 / G-20) TaxID=526225 RepID=D2S5E2_GEOOG|nr:hypothetical protein [Geodermatophilus obscurus]ADB75222.1 hypothetical protein Gobs_2562 [Geodermatophilus obscurus DSM 43160]